MCVRNRFQSDWCNFALHFLSTHSRMYRVSHNLHRKLRYSVQIGVFESELLQIVINRTFKSSNLKRRLFSAVCAFKNPQIKRELVRFRSAFVRLSKGMAMTIFTGEVEVLDPIGMHARPAGQIAKLVKESGLEVVIIREGEETKANSALRLMAMKVKTGEKVTVSVDAADQAAADAVIAQIQEFLKG